MKRIRIDKFYTIKYVCNNCSREVYAEFTKGTKAPIKYDIVCDHCGCTGFRKTLLQSL